MEYFIGLIVLLVIILALLKEYNKNNQKSKKNVNKKIAKNVEIKKNIQDKRVVINDIKELEKIDNYDSSKIELKENNYIKADVSLLDDAKKRSISEEEIRNKTKIIDDTLSAFKINAKVCNVNISTLVSVFEIDISPNTNVDKIKNIFDNFKVSLGNKKIRLIIPIPNKNTIGIEIPNNSEDKIVLKEMLKDIPDEYKDSNILIPVGIDSYGNKKYFDLSKYQNLLVVGASGSGKKTFLHSVITTSLINTTPNELKIIIIDNSKTEFAIYESVNNTYTLVNDLNKIDSIFRTINLEINKRKEEFALVNAKNIYEYNKLTNKLLNFESILLIINSYNDIYQVNKNINNYISEIINNGKDFGINIILSSNNSYSKFEKYIDELDFGSVILFKSNNDFKYNKVTDNDILLGNGDMFCKLYGEKEISRLQAPYVTFEESKRIVDSIRENNVFSEYNYDVTKSILEQKNRNDNVEKDVLYDEILNYAIKVGQISASIIQRKYLIGYNRAAHIIDMLEENGIVGPAKGSKPRDVLVKLDKEDEI